MGFVCFIRARLWGHRVHSGSFPSFGRAPAVERVHSCLFGRPPRVVRFIWISLVHLGPPWRSSGSLRFGHARPRGRLVHSRWFGEFGRDPWAHSGSLGSFERTFGFVQFISVRMDHSPCVAMCLGSGSFQAQVVVIGGRPSGRRRSFGLFCGRVHSRSFGLFGGAPVVIVFAAVVVVFIRVRLVHLDAPLCSSGSFGFV